MIIFFHTLIKYIMFHNRSAITVFGGGAFEVEFYFESDGYWILGPALPTLLYSVQLTADPLGGVILVGGISGMHIIRYNLY